MARKLKFDDLETEIKALILLRPTDLKNVCLVNRQLHELAVKPLYRHVSLDLGSANDTRLSAFLSPRNIGLQHIRQIRLYLANVRDRCNQTQQANFATRLLLEFLPEDTLEEFSWCPWDPFSADNLMLLYKKQRRMKWLEVMDVDRNVLPELVKDVKMQTNLFKHARKLALYPENTETLELCRYFIEKTSDVLEELIIHANFDGPPGPHGHTPLSNGIDTRELNDSATQPGLLSRTLFAHKLPFENCTPFKNLTSLRLHKINLRYCAETWCKLINTSQLRSLRVYHCPGADSFFGQLCKASNLPSQLRVFEFQHKDNEENEALIALDGFLCLTSGIRDLVVDLEHVKSLPAAAGIARHGKTLELLNVHASQECGRSITTSVNDTDIEELVWESEEFEKICKACPKLEQLSCAWPQTSLIRCPSDEWQAYERAVVGELKRLVTCHMSTFPSNKPSTQLLPRTVYEQLLQGLAQRLFDGAVNGLAKSDGSSTPPMAAADDPIAATPLATESVEGGKLRLLAFGISDQIYEREESKNQYIYLKSTCRSALGEEKVYAAPIGWCMRQFVEPRSEVLDFVLHRDTRVPCREASGAGMGGGWGDDDFDVA